MARRQIRQVYHRFFDRSMPVMRLTLLLLVTALVILTDRGVNGNEGQSEEKTEGDIFQPKSIHVERGRSRLKRGGILRKLALPLLLLMKLKAGVTIPALFGIVSLVAFKGLWSGMTALVVSAALALRGLIPPPKIVQLPPAHHHAVISDYYNDYKRVDDVSRLDDYRYGWR